MIVELTVENLAIIDRVQISLGPGFSALTGETGAGKSLLIDAIELALGVRATPELVRSGAKSASVSLVLDLSGEPTMTARCFELGLPIDDGLLYIQREVFAEGRSQCRIGGKLTPVSTLRRLGHSLIDLHGQHDHQSLLDPERHISYLDAWIGSPATQLLGKVANAFDRMQNLQGRLHAVRTGIREREHRIDLLRFQINEIEAIAPQIAEFDELQSQISRLKHLEKLAQGSAFALQSTAEGDVNALDYLAGAVKALEAVQKFDSKLDDLVALLGDSLVQLEEGVHSLRAYVEGLEADPNLLDAVAGRLEALKLLRRKYGDDEARILKFLADSRQELVILEDSGADEQSLSAECSVASEELESCARELSALRVERASRFASLVQTELRDLAMDGALFQVEIQAAVAGPQGADSVEFHFSANVGESPRPLAKIASGGEISRVMLAIKTALAGNAGVPTLIFDEVDVGLGGRAAATVARKLEQLGAHYQVLVISHLPQIACRARTHYRIEKRETLGRATTQVRKLDQQERVQEIARMLAGETITESALENAREMLA